MKSSSLNFFLCCLTFLSSTFSLNTLAADFGSFNSGLQTSMTQTALPADSAFSLNAFIELPNTVVLIWEIEQGYYLYRKSLNFTENNGESTQTPLIPKGVHISDEFFGEVEVYYDRLMVKIPFDAKSSEGSNGIQLIQLQLSYQGCAEIGYCYPMQQKIVSLEIP